MRLSLFLYWVLVPTAFAEGDSSTADRIKTGFRYEAEARLKWPSNNAQARSVHRYDLSYVSTGKRYRILARKRGINEEDLGFVESGFDGRYHFGRYSNDFLLMTVSEETAREKFSTLTGSIDLLTLPFAAFGLQDEDIFSVASHRSSHDVAEAITKFHSNGDSSNHQESNGWTLGWSKQHRWYPERISSEVGDSGFRFTVKEWSPLEPDHSELSVPKIIQMMWFEGQTQVKEINFEVTNFEFGSFEVAKTPFSSTKYVNDLDNGVGKLSKLAFKDGEPRALPPDSAKVALYKACEQAAADSKLVFVKSGFPECGWCQDFDRFHNFEEVKKVIGHHYVVVSIDTRYMPDGEAVFSKLAEPAAPAWAIISPDKKVIVDSYSESGNVGFPFKTHEVEYYLAALRKASPAITDEEAQLISEQLKRAVRQ